MAHALICDAVRTPIGRRRGMLADWHPVDLAAETIAGLVQRNRLDPAEVDDVILGCLDQVDEQAANIARSAALAAGFPHTVPGVTVDRQCGSSQQAIHFAAQGVMAGVYDVVIAGVVESMTRVPMWSNTRDPGLVYGSRLRARYGIPDGEMVSQGVSAELVAERYEIDRDELDELALMSHERAARATDAGRFTREIVPIAVEAGTRFAHDDEGIRRDTSLEALAALKPVFRDDGIVTAGNSSQISDGAAMVLVASEVAAARLGLRARARVRAMTVAGVDPIEMLTGPIPATRKAVYRAGIEVDDVDLFEVNEAFASAVIAWSRATGVEMDRVNVNGGSIALGHPLGCSGARMMATLLHELERRGGRWGLATMCEGMGMANATLIERL